MKLSLFDINFLKLLSDFRKSLYLRILPPNSKLVQSRGPGTMETSQESTIPTTSPEFKIFDNNACRSCQNLLFANRQLQQVYMQLMEEMREKQHEIDILREQKVWFSDTLHFLVNVAD